MLSWCAVLLALWPVLMHFPMYAAFGLGWMVLERPPQMSVDDPGKMGDLVTSLIAASMMMLCPSPIATLGALALGLRVSTDRRSPRAIVLVMCLTAASWASAVLLVRFDPMGVMGWAVD